MEQYVRLKVDDVREFTVKVFNRLGVPVEDARIAADVLVTADQRGVLSHGLPKLGLYVNGLRTGTMKAVADVRILKETPNTLLISGGDGLGQVVGYKAMKLVIDKALKNNIAFAAVRDSNHYGIAGYYAMMALEHDLIGIATTNASALVVPTHGKNAILGTNPIAIAVPAGKERPFVLDMATSIAAIGKLEVYGREGKSTTPLAWAADELGNPTQDVATILVNRRDKKGGGLLPLGGAGEEGGGYKGYGLALAVDIFCGILSGSAFGPKLYASKNAPPKVSHFFGAIRIGAFIEPALFKSMMDEYINILKNSAKAAGKDRIYIAGEKESELYAQQKEQVRIHYSVVQELREIGEAVNVKAPF